MHLFQESHHRVGWITGRIDYPQHSATFIVKGTYRLRLGDVAVPVDPQPELSPDLYVDDDPKAALVYASDFAYYKPRADVLFRGHFHAPGGQPTLAGEASIRVGSLVKTILVVGDRYWVRRPLGVSMTPPEAFTRKEMSYANSFGGPGFASNPLGKGMSTGPESPKWPLPNIESAAEPVAKPEAQPSPAGFGPYNLMWPQRLGKSGTYDDAWKKTRWPWFPHDFDWGFFNVAPPDQQIDYLRGDERVTLVNLHPAHRVYDVFLPRVRPRCFYSPVVGGALFFTEVALNLDTVWIDGDADTVMLVWRGVARLRGDRLGKQDRLLVVSESMDDPLSPVEHYEQRMIRLLAERLPSDELPSLMLPSGGQAEDAEPTALEAAAVQPEPSADDTSAQDSIAFDETVSAAEITDPEPVTREWCLAHYSSGGVFEGMDLSGADLCDASLPGARFHGAILSGAFLRRADLRGADLSHALLGGADLTDADLSNASLGGADLTDARMVRCSLEGATLIGADLTGAVLRGAEMSRVHARKAVLAGANLMDADLSGADLVDADLSNARLHMVTLTRATMRNASIEGASGFPVVADEADLTGLKAANAVLWESSFRFARADGSVWQGAELRDSDFTGARLSKAEFEDASLERVDFTCAVLRHSRLVGADLRDARLVNCDLLGASLEKADLAGATLAYSNLFSAELLDTKLDGADLSGANITRTIVAESV